MTGNVFITGNSAGLGRGLTEAFLARGWRVYGCSRRGCDLAGVAGDARCDLTEPRALDDALSALLGTVPALDLVILNAGRLGRIEPVTETPVEELQALMDVNVWANKRVLDWLHEWGRPVTQLVAISSGAAVLGNRGWGGYALSKAALNMLVRLYAHELPRTHLTAIAPGLIDTAMMDYLCNEPDPDAYPALRRIRAARGTEAMPGPRGAAERVIQALPELRARDSGEFVDIREILAPEEFAALRRAGTHQGAGR